MTTGASPALWATPWRDTSSMRPTARWRASSPGRGAPRFASPLQWAGTAQEKSAAYDSLLAYGGRYRAEGDTVEHHVEVSLFPNWVGWGAGAPGRDRRRCADDLCPASKPARRTPAPPLLVWRRAPAPHPLAEPPMNQKIIEKASPRRCAPRPPRQSALRPRARRAVAAGRCEQTPGRGSGVCRSSEPTPTPPSARAGASSGARSASPRWPCRSNSAWTSPTSVCSLPTWPGWTDDCRSPAPMCCSRRSRPRSPSCWSATWIRRATPSPT